MKFNSFNEYYQYYLTQHTNPMNRRLHMIGSILYVLFLIYFLCTFQVWALVVTVTIGVGFAWVGHKYFEKNEFTF